MKKEKIVAIKRDNLDRIVEFKTNNNKTYNYEMAKEAISNGIIENAVLIKGNDSLFHVMEKGAKNTVLSFQKMEEFN